MTVPIDLARRFTGLDSSGRGHLERLMATWGLLADLSFSDLLLYVPVDEFSLSDAGPLRGLHFVVLGQIRPTTSQTLLDQDLVGEVVAESAVPLVAGTWRDGMKRAGEDRDLPGRGVVEVECVPVRWRGEVVAVLRRTSSPAFGRTQGLLSGVYLEVYDRFAAMIGDGMFPFVSDDAAVEGAPRVGDGVLIVDEKARVTFASPNAISAMHRMGVVTDATGSTLAALGVRLAAIDQALASRLPAIQELERDGEVIVLFRCIPLVAAGSVTGAVVLLRDITDLRRRDRLLLSKDAAIREVHHRVKNNLQTISSLLRLQARRVDGTGPAEALLEAERRIRSMALVHELLSRESGDQVPFDEIVHSLVSMARDSNVTTSPLTLRVDGDAGKVATDIATPLAVVLAELLQNAVEHAFVPAAAPARLPAAHRLWDLSGAAGEPQPARIDVVFRHDPDELFVEVRDNGRGLPDSFDLERSTGLGLALVRDLVRTQLGGTITPSSDHGTVIRLSVPLRPEPSARAR